MNIIKRVKLCQAGQGVNRYLYVLERVYQDNIDDFKDFDKPEIFEN